MSSFAQQSIDLAGTWKFSVGETANYDDTVTLPGRHAGAAGDRGFLCQGRAQGQHVYQGVAR